MEKSFPLQGARPNWYRGRKTRSQGGYFGSLSSLYPGEVFVTFDKKWIVTRTDDGEVSVVQNVCLHAGMEILNQAGTQHKAEIRCSGHQWAYDMRGKLLGAPKFCKFEARLTRPNFSVWNGFILGYSFEELSALSGFGASLGLPEGFLSSGEFLFGKEKEYELPYPCALMGINYLDGLHVSKYHETTFGPVVDEHCYVWEFGPTDTISSYSIQVVRVRPDVRTYVDRLKRRLIRHQPEPVLGWADFHFWLEETMPDAVTPIDKNIFAVWSLLYGEGYVMPELYEGGRFLALSYLVSFEDNDGQMVNRNYVEYYVHHSIPERYRAEALEKFIFAYQQSAREDDELCLKLWAAHRRNDISFDRIVHNSLEVGDAHFREWFLRHFIE